MLIFAEKNIKYCIMKLRLKEILEEKIRQYRKTKSCSESTLMGLCETADADITKEEMKEYLEKYDYLIK